MPDSNALVRLPVAVFTLACRKSMQPPRSNYALPEDPRSSPYMYDEQLEAERYLYFASTACHLLSHVGGGDIPAHRHE